MSSAPRNHAYIIAALAVVWLCFGVCAAQARQPHPRPDVSLPINIADTAIYGEVFALQTNALWNRADRLIDKIEDPSLMGHVLFQRYMHPTAYRARWTELRDWLKNYADQPGAWQVYKLATARKPRGIAMPKQPPSRVYYNEGASEISPLFKTTTKRRIKAHVYDLVQRERPTQALRYINRRAQKNKLSRAERNFLKSLIARSYYIEGKTTKSLEVAKVATASRREVPLSDWHAGLALYRLGEMERAARYFQNLAYNPSASQILRAQAAFWVGRSLRHMGQIAEAENYFAQAASSGAHFYALLAMQYIASDLQIDWQSPEAADERLFATHPALRRAELLRAAEQDNLAELELLYLQERLSEDEAHALLAYAKAHNYPAVQLALAERLSARRKQQLPLEIFEGSYPVPNLDGIDQIDRALLFALIRQESRFKARARSHAGARGLMQIMPQTAAFISGNRALARKHGRDKLLDPSLNIELGQRYLALLISEKYFEDNLIMSLAAYNAGPGNLRRWRKELADVEDPLLFIESLPAAETRKYIHKVMANLWIYRHRLGQEAISRRILAAESWPGYHHQDKGGQSTPAF